MKETILRHAKSAAITFASVLGVEIYAVMQNADAWGDVGWAPAVSAVTFTAARSTLKALILAKSKDS